LKNFISINYHTIDIGVQSDAESSEVINGISFNDGIGDDFSGVSV
jgi:hypothetical protein